MSDETADKIAAEGGGDEDEEDLEKLQKEIERMEAEAARITKETEELEKKTDAKNSVATKGNGDASAKKGDGDGHGRDGHSIYVGQVDYATTPEELLAHFEACGTVERVTIVCDKYTGKPKGYAYLEFQTESAVDNAVKLDGSEFKGRNLKVTPKRVNIAGFSQQAAYNQSGGRGGRGRGHQGRGRAAPYRGGFRGGGRGHRGRGRAAPYHPYY